MFGKSEKEISTLSEVALFTMRDKVSGLCGPLFEAFNVPDAVRFAQRIRIAAYEDFELLCVGKFDRSRGRGEMFKAPYVHPWITEKYRSEVEQHWQKPLSFAVADAINETREKSL